MDTVYATCALVAVFLGLALAIAHMVAFAIATVRRWPTRPEWVSVQPVVNGLALALTAFYLARGLSTGDWGGVTDFTGLMILLAVATWGYGATYEWWVSLELPHRPRVVTPFALSAVTGLFLGLSVGPLGI